IAPHIVKSLSELSPLLQFVAKSAWWVCMGSFLWLPLMLPMIIVSWWARRQLEFQSSKSSSASPPSTLVFWTIPALLLLCALLGWMLYRWATAGADMARFIIPTVISSMGILLYAVSLPLWLRLVPMNSWYGVRLPSTFLSDERWYEVNAHFGKHLFWWSLAVIGAGIAGFYQLPRHQDSYPWAAVTLSLVAVAASVISTLWWMHQNPVDTPKPKRGRLAKLSGQVVVATVIALFIRAFIVHSYSIPNGGEPGVAKGSYWLASRLNTGFAAGELIAFQHESGHTWLARVVAKEDKGLRLKRGGSPDEFFMPWDKIVGKMWFSYLSPDALAIPSASTPPVSAKPTSVNQGTAIAVDRKPELVALRLRSDKQQWTNQCFDPFGNKVSMEEHRLSVPSPGSISENGHDGWLQLWFSHPDFDSSSMPKLKLFSSSGLLQSEARETLGPEVKSGNNLVSSAVMRLTQKIQSLELLPKKIRLVLRYSVGPWSNSEYLSTGLRGTIELRQPCQITAIGETEAGTSFVALTQRDDSRQFQCLAILKSGSVAEMDYSIYGGGIQPLNAKIEFTARLAEINYFEIRSRLIREVTFSDVVLPPLPKP
ncbi:MAG: SdpI family protein, partial [Prosthecobacter sp.]